MKLTGLSYTAPTRFIATLLLVKGITFEQDSSMKTTLQDRDLILDDPLVITDYIEAKHPYPPLIDPEIPKRAVQLTLTNRILHYDVALKDLQDMVLIRSPFILGSRLSILDLAINAVVQDPGLTEAINAVAQRTVF